MMSYFVCLSVMCILLFRLLRVRIYLVINGIPTTYCFISVMWNVCLNGLVKTLYFNFITLSGNEEKLDFSKISRT